MLRIPEGFVEALVQSLASMLFRFVLGIQNFCHQRYWTRCMSAYVVYI
jgi:hypothetical protein